MEGEHGAASMGVVGISLSANVGQPSSKMRRSPSARALAGGKLGLITEKMGSDVEGVQGNSGFIPVTLSHFPCWMSGITS